MTPEHTPLTGQITTSTDTAAAEPSLTLTQLHALLREATAYERAQHPIVIYTTQTAPAPQPAAQTSASLALPPTGPGPTAPPVAVRRGWGVRLAYASLAALLTGAADGVLTGTEPLPVLLCALGILGAVGGTARAVVEQDRGMQP